MKLFFCFLFLVSSSTKVLNKNLAVTSFEKIEFAMYDYMDKVRVFYYVVIDKKGNAKVQEVNSARTKSYTTTLNDTVLQKLKTFFNDQKELKGYQIKEKLDENAHYAGTYNYINVVYPVKKDFLCYVNDFMSEEFNKMINELIEIDLEVNPIKKDLHIITPDITGVITTLHKKNRNLPKFELPPPVMN